MGKDLKTYSDEELVEGCIKNHRLSQERLYRKYFPSMIRFCLRYTQDEQTALLILNSGFLKVFQNIDKFSFRGSLQGWIRKLIFHSISDHFRKEAKYGEMIIFEEKDDSIHESVLTKLYVDDILKMIRKLPPRTAEVFELYAIQGFNHREIGTELGISEGTSKWHLSEARKQLKEALKKYPKATEWQGFRQN